MEGASRKTILRIELWHGLMLLALLFTLGPKRWIEPSGLLIGGLFMGVNFLLLSYGVAWLLAPLAGRGKVRLGIAFLVLKIVIFLGLLSTVFFTFAVDALSFALGFSTLLVAILIEALWLKLKAGV